MIYFFAVVNTVNAVKWGGVSCRYIFPGRDGLFFFENTGSFQDLEQLQFFYPGHFLPMRSKIVPGSILQSPQKLHSWTKEYEI